MNLSDVRQRVFHHLQQDGMVLTANQRLSRELLSDFEGRSLDQGAKAWQTPHIIELNQWLTKHLFPRLFPEAHLLNEVQSLVLWEQAVESDLALSGDDLLQVALTAKKALEAQRLLNLYGVETKSDWLTPDQEAFLRWQAWVKHQCDLHGWIDASEIPDKVVQAIAKKRYRPTGDLLVVGFDENPPHLLSLQTALQSVGVRCEIVPSPEGGQAFRTSDASPDHEIRLAARWARRKMASGAQRIGIVVLDSSYRSRLERLFREEIDPEQSLQTAPASTSFTLSLGAPLAQEGVIAFALFVLGLQQRIDSEAASRLLRSPYMGGGWSERHQRGLLDARLRGAHTAHFSLRALIRKAQKQDRSRRCPDSMEHIKAWLDCRQEKAVSPAEWVQIFDRELTALGWPGDRTLASREFQALKAWQTKVLPKMVGLGALKTKMKRADALRLLTQISRDTLFQEEAPQGAIQVLGALEAAGLMFDGLWVLGASERSLPQAAQPNPFLPVSLQVEADMPHSSAAKELRYARQLIGRLQASAPEVVFSVAERTGDCPQRPSPLIMDFPTLELSHEKGAIDPRSRMQDHRPSMEFMVDVRGEPIADGDTMAGGTALIKDQALCPFRAYGHFRLLARELGAPEIGLDSLLRGTLIHRILETFWQKTGSLASMQHLSLEQRADRVKESTDDAMERYLADTAGMPDILLHLEQDRLSQLALEWLAVEEQREPFVVDSTERACDVQLDRMKLRMVVDRTDRLENGSKVVIDYKTGLVDLQGLHPDHLSEPQLPLYATSGTDNPPDGVVLAQVRRGRCAFRGCVRETGHFPGVQGLDQEKERDKWGMEDWASLLQQWGTRIERLAADFCQGEAPVAPMDPVKTCEFCDLQAFCRIAEKTQGAGS